MIPSLALSMLLALSAGPLLAANCIGAHCPPQPARSAAEQKYDEAVRANGPDHPAAIAGLQAFQASMPPGSTQARALTYQLAASYYRQLRYSEAEALIAPFAQAVPPRQSPYNEWKRDSDAMIALVRKGELNGALAAGKTALSGDETTYTMATSKLAAAQDVVDKHLPARPDDMLGAIQRISDRNNVYSENHKVNLVREHLAHTYSAVGELHHALKQFPQAEKMYKASLMLFGEKMPLDPTVHMRTQTALAILHRQRGDAASALPLLQEARAALAALGPDHPDVLEIDSELAHVHKAMKNHTRR